MSTSSNPIKSARVEQSDQYQLRGLEAQEDMAFWAMWMFVAAVATFAITSIGTFLIWRQVRLTRKAVEDTSAATETMKEANRIAEENSHRQLRAYLSVKSVTVSESDWDDERLQIMIEAENAGQTPAVLRSIVMRAAWATESGDRNLVDHTSKNQVPCHRNTPMHIPLSFKCDDELLGKEGHLTVVGRIEYDDVFGKRQKEPFSFRTQEGHFYPLLDHVFPIRLAAFSPLSMIEAIEEFEKKHGKLTKAK